MWELSQIKVLQLNLKNVGTLTFYENRVFKMKTKSILNGNPNSLKNIFEPNLYKIPACLNAFSFSF